MSLSKPNQRASLLELIQDTDYAGIAAGSTGHGPLRSITYSEVLIRADARAKLMFYIHVVVGVLGLTNDEDLRRFGDYQRYQGIKSLEDMMRLVEIAEELHPRKLLDKRLFEESDISNGMRFKVKTMESTGVVMDRKTLEGVPYTVTDLFTIMSCNSLWIHNHFYLPFTCCDQIATNLRAQEIEKQRQADEIEHRHKLDEVEKRRKEKEIEQEHRVKMLEEEKNLIENEQQLKIIDLEQERDERQRLIDEMNDELQQLQKEKEEALKRKQESCVCTII